jgi:glycosyltransferase involved in cell wall biosynthesis
MRLLINALNARQGGGQTYLMNLLRYLPQDGSFDVTLLVGPSFKSPMPMPGVRFIQAARWLENPLARSVWERFRLPVLLKQNGVEVLFCPGGVVITKPPQGCRLVTMFQNMIPFDIRQRRRYPLGYMRLRVWLLARIMVRSMLNADLVIFISEYAKSVIEREMGGSLRHAVVIPHGVADEFRRDSHSELPRPSWLPSGDYLLYVSSVDVYKAQLEVVQAFARLDPLGRGLHLLLVGPEHEFYSDQVRREISRLRLDSQIHLLGKVPHRELPALYQHARMNIFASECENCPNILLEALASGRAVVCSNRQPMPEFGGDAVLYFDPADPVALSACLQLLLDDEARADSLARSARRRADQFSWQRSAMQTWHAIAELGRKRDYT